jgi:hypothetical protein
MQETDGNLMHKFRSEFTVLTIIQQQYNILRNKYYNYHLQLEFPPNNPYYMDTLNSRFHYIFSLPTAQIHFLQWVPPSGPVYNL